MDRWGFEPQASRMPISLNTGNTDNTTYPVSSFKVSKDLVRDYFKYRESRAKSKNWINWTKRQIREYLEFSNYTINAEKLGEFQNWYKSKYGYEAQSKYHTNLRNFLEWLYRRTRNPLLRDLKDILEAPRRNSKKLNPIIIREDDIRNIIKAIQEMPVSKYNPEYQIDYFKLKYITATLLGAYTGQRPEATIGKLTFQDIEEALERDPPMLWIPEEKDKENFPHWVPIHPVLEKWLRKVIEAKEIAPSERPFPYDPLRKLYDKLNVKAIHTGRKITPSHLRKFFEQMCNNVLVVQLPDGRTVPAMHPGLRDYIMAHNTGSLDVQSYDGKLPSEIYEQYMNAWKEVNLLPKN